MTEWDYSKIVVACTGAITTFATKIYAADLIEPDTFSTFIGYLEAFIQEVKQDFSSGVIGGLAGISVLYVKKGLKELYLLARHRLTRKKVQQKSRSES